MPHVVLNGEVVLEDVFKEIDPLFIQQENNILKTMEVYLERGKNAILVDSLSFENSKKTVFLVMITSREDGIVVRLYPKIGVDKTEGVKRILGELAKQLLAKFPELRVGETNLGDYLR